MSYTDAVADFIGAMEADGIVPAEPIADRLSGGDLIRFRCEGDGRGRQNGWAILYLDEWPAGAFGNYRLGLSLKWKSGGNVSLSPEERRRLSREWEEAKARRADERVRCHQEAAAEAVEMWNAAGPVSGDHPYQVQRPIADALIDELKARKIDYLDIDPFVSSHSVNENDNGAIDAVTKEWVRVASEANCAVSLAHHVRKTSNTEATAVDARGAVSMINAARSVLVFQKMTKEAAEEFRIPECDRKRFFSVYDDKNNKAPPAARAEWYEFVGVGLGNGDDTGPEDNVGAIKRWEAPDTFGGVTARQLRLIQEEMNRRPADCRKHPMSSRWVGKIAAHVLGLDLDDNGDRRRIERMIRTWCSTGAMRSIERSDGNRDKREFVEVAQLAIVE